MVKGTITNEFDQPREKFKGLTDDRGQYYILRKLCFIW